MWMPRAATFVATRTVTAPVLNCASVRVRCGCDLPLCSPSARTPMARRCFTNWSTPCLVSRNISTRPSRAAISVAAEYLSAEWMCSTWWSIVLTEAADGSTVWETGSFR